MDDGTCITKHCDKPAAIQGCCHTHYRSRLKDHRASHRSPSRKRHILSDIDQVNRVATCSSCGPSTKIRRAGHPGVFPAPGEVAWTCLRKPAQDVAGQDSGTPEASARRNWLWTKYRLSVREYDDLLRRQAWRCAICQELPGDDRFLAVDHDHQCCPDGSRTCGECIRGLLCFRCNTGIGRFNDDPDLLLRALSYLLGASHAMNLPFDVIATVPRMKAERDARASRPVR